MNAIKIFVVKVLTEKSELAKLSDQKSALSSGASGFPIYL